MSGYENHAFGAWITVKEATETEEGLAERKCNICDYKETKKIDKLPHTHTFSEEWTSDVTGHWHASTCGHDVTTPKESHTYGDYTVTKEATETEVGSKERVCSVCGYKDIAEIEKLAHTHKFADTYSADDTYHWYASTCNHPETEVKELHKYSSWKVTKEASETEEGTKERVCSICGHKQTQSIDKLQHTHTFSDAWVSDEEGHWHEATCNHTDVIVGYAAHTFGSDNKCSVCGYEKTAEVVVDESYEATFTWSTDYSTVTITIKAKSDGSTVKTIELAPTKTSVAATCEASGKDTYTISYTYKGVAYTDTKEVTVDALGHDYEFAQIVWDDTNRTAKAVYICKNNHEHEVEYDCTITVKSASPKEDGSKCVVVYTAKDDTHTDDNEYELDHTYGSWTVTKEATTTEEGLKERTCTCCGHKETAKIDMLPEAGEYADLTKSGIYTGTYYSSITTAMLSNASQLETALTTLINTNYTRFSYSQDVQKLQITDSYDLDYVECIYTGQRIEKSNSGSNTGAWNKEHVWAKSHGFNDEKYDAYSDMHHLRVSEANINSTRSNYPFDEIPDSYTTSSNYGYDEFGNEWYKSGNNSIFEPRDDAKGDIARMLLYMTIKYNGTYSNDGLNLILRLTDDKSLIWSETNTGDGNYGGTHYLGMLSTLIKWHYQDPVDEREVFRNNEIFKLQKNRNPFIDHPEYVYYLYTTESSSYITEANLASLDSYVASNATAIAAIEAEVNSLPTTLTLANEETVNDILAKYDSLGQVSKSFFKKYRKMTEAAKQIEILKSAASQDTSISTTISFKNLSNTTGSVVNNGITVAYVASGNHADFGIYAQGTSQGTKPATLTVNGGYANIKKVIFSLTTNNKSGTTADITITDGTKTVTASAQAVTYTTSKTTVSTITVDVTSLDLTKTITITVKNNSSSSVRIKDVTFSIS